VTSSTSGEPSPAFVDTNVLVYAIEQETSERQLTAARLLDRLMDGDLLRTSTQVLKELYVTLTRKVAEPASPAAALAYLERLSAWPVFETDVGAVFDACRLSDRATISMWDALIVVAARRSGCPILYTEDLNHGQEIVGVRIVNPFRDAG